jgi:hypothetical protein
MAATKKKAARKPSRALNAAKPPKKAANGVEKVKPEPKAPVWETMLLPVPLLMAAESIAAKADKERVGLQGVMLHQKDGGAGRIVGSDGTRLFVGSFPVGSKPPTWLKTGLVLPREDLKARVNMIAKVAGSEVQIKHAKGEAFAFLSDTNDTMLFRVQCGEVTAFPPYENVFNIQSFSDMTEEGDMVEKREWEPVGFNSRHLKHVGEVAKILEAGMPKDSREKNGMTIRVFDNGEPSAPRVFDFVGWPGALLVIAAVQLTQTVLPLQTAKLLAPAVKLTLAALRAHATRWLDAATKADGEVAKAACLAKARGFQERVAAILAVTPDLASPAIGTDAKPEPEAEAEAEPVLTRAEKAAATRKRKQAAGATVH